MSEVASDGGLCSAWITVEEVTAIPKYASVDPTLLEMVILSASEILYMKSGQQWPGTCTASVRPCCGHSFDRCDCSCASVLDIGFYPIVEVMNISIDLETDFQDHSLWDYRYIRRTDGVGWPSCQDLRQPLGQLNTFGVTVKYGMTPPPAALLAAKIFAGELALAVAGDEDNCRLPRALVSSIVRQGVTVAFRNSTETLEHGLTGIHEVDMWLTTVPSGLRSAGAAQVFIPEFHKKSTQQIT